MSSKVDYKHRDKEQSYFRCLILWTGKSVALLDIIQEHIMIQIEHFSGLIVIFFIPQFSYLCPMSVLHESI